MSYPISLNIEKRQAQSLKQTQRLIMSPQMQQAIKLLQLPVLELSQMIEAEMENNPILEYSDDRTEEDSDLERLEESITEEAADTDVDPAKEVEFNDDDFEVLKQLDEEFKDHFSESDNYYTKRTADEEKLKSFLENSVLAERTLYEHLLEQAQGEFDNAEELAAAKEIIGNIDDRGFLTVSLEEIASLSVCHIDTLEKVLERIKTFDPPGIGAASLQESLLIQLKLRGKEESLSYQIIDQYYEPLLNNRMLYIAKKLNCTPTDVSKAVQEEIAHLNIHPGAEYSSDYAQQITPDLSIHEEDGVLNIVINDEYIPNVRINYKYIKMCSDPSVAESSRDYIKQKLLSAKWLMRNIHERNSTLQRIAEVLVKHQGRFFRSPSGELQPMTMKQVADELNLHESTIARAVANKYLSCDRGVFPLRHFFSFAYVNEKGEDISSETVRKMLQKLISKEDKLHPLSDSTLSKMLQDKGISCAHRTVAKYRSELHIGNAQQRRKFT